ncbi:MAG: hypothetical protein ABJE47_23910 [bacterium]
MRLFRTSRVVFTVVLWSLAFGGCRQTDSQVNEQLNRQARLAAGASVRLQDVTSFPWDSVRIAGPYDAPRTASDSSTKVWQAISKTGLASRDDIDVLVFLREGQVVAVVEHPRRLGDFDSTAVRRTYTRSEAVFASRMNPADSTTTLSYPERKLMP